MTTTIQTIVEAAEKLLCEAVMLTIFQAYQDSQKGTSPAPFTGIGPAAISERAGIYRKGDPLNEAIAHGILNKLREDGKVEHLKPGWILSQSELDSRQKAEQK